MNLIVTADDFGRSHEINAAVLAAHRRGILTAASLMVGGDAFAEAVEMARQTPTLAVGLHLVVVDGRAVLPAGRIGRLVNGDGCFPNTPGRLGVRYFFNPAARRELALEIEAQFDRFAATGLPLAHVDGHQHMHLHPAVFPILLPLAEKFGAGGVRVPADALRLALRYDSSAVTTKVAWEIIFSLLGLRCRRLLRGRPLATAQRVYGLMQTGQMREAYVLALLEHVRGESAEIYFHPTTGARTDAMGPNPEDLEALLSPAVRQAVESRHIRLCDYRDLPRGGR